MFDTVEEMKALASKLLDKMPEKPATAKALPSKASKVAAIAKEIKILQQRGYTLEEIRDSLLGEGFDISTPTLKNYLSRSKAKAGSTKSKPKAKASATEKKTPVRASGKESAQGGDKGKFTARRDSDQI